MLQNPCKTLGFKKNMVYKIPPGGEVNHIQPVAYMLSLCNKRCLRWEHVGPQLTKCSGSAQFIIEGKYMLPVCLCLKDLQM